MRPLVRNQAGLLRSLHRGGSKAVLHVGIILCDCGYLETR
jgi:hypothetical protein